MKRKHRRLSFLAVGLALLGIAAFLVLSALDESLVFFMSPSEVMANPPPPDRAIRMGGLVEEGSLERAGDAVVHFRVTDLATTVPVSYEGVLPDLFREGQGVVVEGWLAADGAFTARSVLAKHDENYMPAEVADAIKNSGHWQGDDEAAADGATQ
jgi:cytochrome c-type biogenesis protein CcmE